MHAAAPSIADRIARTRSQQAKALSGAGQQPARRLEVKAPAPPAPVVIATSPAREDMPVMTATVDGLRKEFEQLLVVARRVYGYQDADAEFVRAAVISDRAGADRELELVVRQWRIDAVTAGLDADGSLPDGVAQRARIQFRMSIMGQARSESGAPYAPDALEWCEESPAPAPAQTIEPVMSAEAPAPVSASAPTQAPQVIDASESVPKRATLDKYRSRRT